MAQRKDKDRGDGRGDRPLSPEPDARWTTEHPHVASRGIKIQEVMTAEVFTIAAGGACSEAARLMRDNDIGFLPVVDSDNSVAGVVTDRDLVLRLLAEERAVHTPVEELMTEEVISCHAGDDLALCEHLMRENQVRRLVVLGDDEQLAGVVSLADLAQVDSERQVGAVIADVTTADAEPH